ncbi:MAG: spore protease YyaC [Eubacteriales bacterium]|nr:spore protease YyaC [Eubacteriales bacterium]
MDFFKCYYKDNQSYGFFKQSGYPKYFHPEQDSVAAFSCALSAILHKTRKEKQSLLILCIGTDKITGDCLGPLVGTRLLEQRCPIPVYGTLQYPVHASNLSTIVTKIRRDFHNPFLIVVDASVGTREKVGYVSFSTEPVYPGRGVCRPLFPIGNLSLTGIIHEDSPHCEIQLPYTRLYTIYRMADYLCKVILRVTSDIPDTE